MERNLRFNILFLLIGFSLWMSSFIAKGMSSENYKIQYDSINIGGREQSSDTYRLRETIGEIATDESQSEFYRIKAGYQQMEEELYYIDVIYSNI